MSKEAGISKDILDGQFGEAPSRPHGGWLFKLLSYFINNGNPVFHHYVTTGDSQTKPLCPEIDAVIPRLNITNNGTGTVYLGSKGQCSPNVGSSIYPLTSGLTLTLTYKNPFRSGLCFNDGGTAAILDIAG